MADNQSPGAVAAGPAPANALGNAASDRLKQVFEQVAQVAQNAAKQRLDSNNGGGAMMQTSMPGIPAPIVAGQHQVSGQLPLEGGGSDIYGERVASDKTRLVNQIAAAADTALANHTEKKNAQMQREYEIILTAMQGLKSPDPNIRAQNANVLNHFFDGPDGEKRAKAIMKATGMDVFDAKKQQELQNDPHNKAITAAASKVGTQAAVPVSATSGAVTPTAAPANANGLNDSAQRFVNLFPQVDTGRQYVPSGEETAAKWRIDNKLAPDANTFLAQTTEFNKQLVKSLSEIGVADAQVISSKDVEALKQSQENWRKAYGEENSWRIAQLVAQTAMWNRALERAKLGLEAKKFDLESNKSYLEMAKNAYDNAIQNEAVVGKIVSETTKDNLAGSDEKAKNSELLTTTRKATLDARTRYESAQKTFMENSAKERGVNVLPTGDADARRVVNEFDKRTKQSDAVFGSVTQQSSGPGGNSNGAAKTPSVWDILGGTAAASGGGKK
jgi:hypothetical protein